MVVDRLVAEPASRGPRGEAVATAFQEGEGIALVLAARTAAEPAPLHRIPRLQRLRHAGRDGDPGPVLLQQPSRAPAPHCNGFGAMLEYDESLIVPDPARSLAEGAIDPWTKPRYEIAPAAAARLARRLGADPDKPWHKIKAASGASCSTAERAATSGSSRSSRIWRRSGTSSTSGSSSGSISSPRPARPAAGPGSTRMRWRSGSATTPSPTSPAARSTGSTMAARARARPRSSARSPSSSSTSSTPASSFLRDVGLGYLTLDRQTRTLSGGEAQRISLANALGSRLVDTLYVLDEPSVGLHPRDTDRLLALLRRLRDAGNTVVVVEHDLAAIRQADFMLELGPGAGEHGGRVVHAGPVARRARRSPGNTSPGEKRIAVPSSAGAPGRAAPVTAVRVPSGISTSTSLRLWRSAPRTRSQRGPAGRRRLGTAIRFSPVRYWPVSDAVAAAPAGVDHPARRARRRRGRARA